MGIYCVLLNLASCKVYLVEVEDSSIYSDDKLPLNQELNLGNYLGKDNYMIQDQDKYDDYVNLEDIGGALQVLGTAFKTLFPTKDSSEPTSTPEDSVAESETSTPDDSVVESDSETSQSGANGVSYKKQSEILR